MTREEQIQKACDAYYDETWDEHGGKAMVVDGYHDIWFPSQATDDFYKAGAEWAGKHPNLTWEDIRKICLIAENVHKYYGFWTQIVYEEILDRFSKPEIWT